MKGSIMIKEDTCRMVVTEIDQFLGNPPPGFMVETHSTVYLVKSDLDTCLVLIDDFESSKGKVVFQSSLGRKIKAGNLWDYTSVRKSLLSKRIYMLVTLCEENKKATEPTELMQYVVSIDGSDPFIKWQIERGLDWTISSVAGESYRVDIDLNEELQKWSERNFHIPTNRGSVMPVWRDTCFTLKYYSDALFDFPHWFGFSKRKFMLRLT